ncbi:MAG: tripartite tricarboxylate transporter permease, partial [Microvirga sp.]
MDILANVAQGFAVALQPVNLLACFIGVFIGTLVGVLPGIGPVSAMSLLLPVTLAGSPESGIIMMAGIYYGSMYGGSTTSILVNIPGEAASVVTCLDGHQMARQGRAGPALGIAALGSFFAGTFAIVALMLVAPALANVAIAFGPAEYFSLMVLGLTVLTFLTQGSMAKALLMACVGAVLGLIGLDSITAQPRLTFERIELYDGIGLVPVVMGLFGIAEVLSNIERPISRQILDAKITQLWPSRADWRASAAPVMRGTLLGFFLGILPGGGAVIASFASYALEKRVSKTPERFGRGAIEGVAGPEAANNASAAGTLVPLLTLGLPTSATAAIMLAAFQIFNLQPGPELFERNSDLVWTLIASLYVANVMLLLLNLPLVQVWIRVLDIPRPLLYSGILVFGTLGVYSLSASAVDVLVMYAIGVMGFFMRRYDFPIAPVILGVILGPLMEAQFRRTLIVSDGDLSALLSRPLSILLAILAVCAIGLPYLPAGIARLRGR